MRTFDRSTAATYFVRDVEVARWEQYSLGESMPFQNMWYTVPPGASGPADCHPERELSIVVSGSALVEAPGRRDEVLEGNAFLLESMETHVVHNLSADRPLLIFSSYWMPHPGVHALPVDQEAIGA
jgi:mannose-6-phosphate isomerase-like protein (cupin superfamily)